MDFAVVQRPEMFVAGTVLRSPALALDGAPRRRLESVWKHHLENGLPGPPATAYADYDQDLKTYLTQIVGYRCRDLNDLAVGDAMVRLPGGTFASFTARNDDIGMAIESVWHQVWDAEAEGAIVRAYSGDFERYPDNCTVSVFVALAADPRERSQ